MKDGVTYSNTSDKEENIGLSMKINDDKKTATLSIDWNIFGQLSGASTWLAQVTNYQVSGFNKNIASTYLGEFGQDVTGATLFYIMEDGTVQYTTMFINKTDTQGNSYYVMNYSADNNFITSGELNVINNAVKLYTVNT